VNPEKMGPSALHLITGVAAALVFGALLWIVLPILNPFLLFLGLAALLFPFRGAAPVAPILWVSAGLTGFWLLSELGGLLTPFVLAVVLAYILNPAVTRIAHASWMRRLGWSAESARSVAVVLLLLPFLAVGLVGGFWGGAWITNEFASLSARIPLLLSRSGTVLQGVEDWVLALRIPGFEGAAWIQRMRELKADDVVHLLSERKVEILAWLQTGALGVGRGVGIALTLVSALVLTPVIGFYLLRDWDRIVAVVAGNVPPRHAHLLRLGREYDTLLSAYLRGQVAVSALVGAVTAAGLFLVQFPAALFLGLVVAIFNVVPYLGVALSLIPALILAVSAEAVGTALLKVILVYGVAQTLESVVFSPRIVGESTGLHPVWILLAISIAGFFFGFVGLLLAVPLAVGVKLLVREALARDRAAPSEVPLNHQSSKRGNPTPPGE
jgi:predicted PurR-regulated permease PerM